MVECNPADKIEDIILKITNYNPSIVTKDTDYLEAKIISEFKEELWIEVESEFSIFFGDWHEHFFAYEEEYQGFLDDLFGILENRKYTVCIYKGNHWCRSVLLESEILDESTLINKYGKDKTIKCNFWDKTKNIVFEP